MMAALVMSISVMVAKVMTHAIVVRMKKSIANVDAEKSRTLNELKAAKSQKAICVANQKKLEMKSTKLKGKISRLSKEIKTTEGEAEHRQQVRDVARGKLIRPTRVGSGGEAEAEAE